MGDGTELGEDDDGLFFDDELGVKLDNDDEEPPGSNLLHLSRVY